MAYFSDETLATLQCELANVPDKQQALQVRYIEKIFCNDRAKEFAHHGYVRRLRTLARCIENVFALIPPDRTEPVDQDVLKDAEINIQASVFNVFAATDNLAWIWVEEQGIRQANGAAVPARYVGLRRSNQLVRASLPQPLRDYLTGLDDWFGMVDDYRHALAHRIPLYIPPYIIDPDDEERYQNLQREMNQAILAGNIEEHAQLAAEQNQLKTFRPWMQHSFGEQARPLVFHPQLLQNFITIEEIGRRLLEALDA